MNTPTEHEKTIIETAKRVLLKNIGMFRGTCFLYAGRGQFRSFWTRDFSFSVPGLLVMGKSKVVKDHLLYLLHHRRSDGLIPRLLFVNNFKIQIIAKTWLRFLFRREGRVRDPESQVYPNMIGEHGTPAFDGNALVILGLIALHEDQNKEASFDLYEYKQEIIELCRFYESYIDDTLVTQPAFSDWQDSVKREGKTSYMNLLYWIVSKKLTEYEIISVDHERIREKIQETFTDIETGLLLSIVGKENISLGTNLLALEYDFFDDSRAVYESLKKTPLWSSHDLPGLTTYPNYVKRNKSFTTNWSGLEHYHDNMVWSWLVGKAIKVAKMMGDTSEAQKATNQLYELVIRDETILEIYEPDTLNEFVTTLYDSEKDFSWGSAVILEALLFGK